MKRKWQKLGLIYSPSKTNNHPKLLSHAANPLPIFLKDNIYRVFYNGRDNKNRSSIGAVDIDIVTRSISKEYFYPFFAHGEKGSFYADGISIGNCCEINRTHYLFFMGWCTSKSGSWKGEIGRLLMEPDLTLKLVSKEPLMKASPEDPLSLSYPCVIKTRSNNYTMWYGSTLAWDAGNGEMQHILHYASSEDGTTWHRQGLAVPYIMGVAQAFSRPTVLRNADGSYEMWFSYRGGMGSTYRIGYAYSTDGLKWELALEKAGIDVSSIGWDSEMIEYPFVFDHNGQRYMLYNGNSYGKTGFGLAILK